MKSEDWTQPSGLGLRSWASLCSPRLLWRGRSQQARRRLMAGTAEGSRHPIKNGLSAGAHKRAERAGPCEPLAAAKRILLVFLFPPSPSDPSSSFGFGALSSFFSTPSPVLPRASTRLRCVSAASCSTGSSLVQAHRTRTQRSGTTTARGQTASERRPRLLYVRPLPPLLLYLPSGGVDMQGST